MADIDVVQKKSSASWLLWVILALAAIVILWMLLGRGNQTTQVGTNSGQGHALATPVIDRSLI